jgi:hypothetical protein
MKVYFVTTGLREEIEVIKKVRPPRLLCSFWYFKNKPLADFCEEIGYTPEILLDSGAYSAYTKGKNVSVNGYIGYIKNNAAYISRYITADVIGNTDATYFMWRMMQVYGLDPVPVVHYGGAVASDMFNYGLVALGNTVGVRDKCKVARWCQSIKKDFPHSDLHLLGSSSRAILESGALCSCDSSSWYMLAVNGKPKEIPGKTREAKIARAEANMRRIMEEFNEEPVPFTDNSSEPADR